jgi:PEP-CTERM motif
MLVMETILMNRVISIFSVLALAAIYSATASATISYELRSVDTGTLDVTVPGGAGTIVAYELYLQSDEPNITTVFGSIAVDPNFLTFLPNPDSFAPGQIYFNLSTFEGIARVSHPALNPGDPDGVVRAANFAAVSSPGVTDAEALLATIAFETTGMAGASNIEVIYQIGDDVTVDGVSQGMAVETATIAAGLNVGVITVPEPTSLLLSCASLGSVALIVRRRQASRG